MAETKLNSCELCGDPAIDGRRCRACRRAMACTPRDRYRAEAYYLGASWSGNGPTEDAAKDAVVAQILRVKGFAPPRPLTFTIRDTRTALTQPETMAEPYAPGSKEWWLVRQVANGDERRSWYELTDADQEALAAAPPPPDGEVEPQYSSKSSAFQLASTSKPPLDEPERAAGVCNLLDLAAQLAERLADPEWRAKWNATVNPPPSACTCMDVLGEDPNCSIHGDGTEWDKANPGPCAEDEA